MAKEINTIKKTIAFYWQHAWHYPKYMIGLILIVPLTILLHQFLPPLIAAQILDRLSKGDYVKDDLWGSFGTDLLIYAAMLIAGGVVLWRVVIVLIWKLEAFVVRDIHRHVLNHLLAMSANFHANRFGGSLVSQTGKLASAYIRIADTTVFEVTTMILAFTFTAIILVPRAPLFAALLFVFSALFIITSVFATRRVRELNAKEAEAENKQTGILADAISNIMAVKSFAAGQPEHKRYAEATEHTRRSVMDVMRAATIRDVYFASVTSGIGILAIFMATAGVVHWDADIGTMFLILTYTANIGQRLWEFSQHVLRNYNRGFAEAKEMIQILGIQPEVKDPTNPEPPRIHRGEIVLKDILFAHADDKQGDALFSKLSLHIKAGERIGLVGHSGSGKTTLTKLLLRFANIDSGQILIDGQNIAHVAQDDLRDHIAYVPQEPLLFHRTIRENIAYGRPNASETDIKQAAIKANAAEFIQKLPKGYDTLVGERGVKLSGGQRQRVAIARAMLKDAPILVLDEATSALDSESERLIQDALWQLMQDRTAIVIAHRLSTVQKMDRIVVLEDGKITEQGSHAQLLAHGGIYATLWSHQSGGFIKE